MHEDAFGTLWRVPWQANTTSSPGSAWGGVTRRSIWLGSSSPTPWSALRLPPPARFGHRQRANSASRSFGKSTAACPTSRPGARSCGGVLRQWSRFCSRCGRDISGIAPSPTGQSRESLRRTRARSRRRKVRRDRRDEPRRGRRNGLLRPRAGDGSGRRPAVRGRSGGDAADDSHAVRGVGSENRAAGGQASVDRPAPSSGVCAAERVVARLSTATGAGCRGQARSSAANGKTAWTVTRVGIVSAAVLVLILVALLIYRFL